MNFGDKLYFSGMLYLIMTIVISVSKTNSSFHKTMGFIFNILAIIFVGISVFIG